MKLPNGHKAIVYIRKLTDFYLNFDHPRGRNKARVFQTALGLTVDNACELKRVLIEKAMSMDCIEGIADDYGARYLVDFVYTKSGREAMLRSTWIVKSGEDTPRLTSCFVL